MGSLFDKYTKHGGSARNHSSLTYEGVVHGGTTLASAHHQQPVNWNFKGPGYSKVCFKEITKLISFTIFQNLILQKSLTLCAVKQKVLNGSV